MPAIFSVYANLQIVFEELPTEQYKLFNEDDKSVVFSLVWNFHGKEPPVMTMWYLRGLIERAGTVYSVPALSIQHHQLLTTRAGNGKQPPVMTMWY